MRIFAVTDARKTLGILTFKVPGIPDADAETTICAEIDGVVAHNASAATVHESQLDLNIHTHLLCDGPHKITVRVKHPRGGIASASASASANFRVRNNTLLSRQVAELLSDSKVPLAFGGACDSSRYPYDGDRPMPWFDRPDAGKYIDRLLANEQVSASEADALRKFVKDGFMILDGLIDDTLVAAVNREIDETIARGYQGYRYGSSQRIEHLHKHQANMRRLWLDRRHLRWAGILFNSPARPSQTLTFVFGSQQDAHQDTIHLTPFPAGYMCGIWIALQDVEDDSGELVVYPGSHREPRVYLRDTGCHKVGADWSEFGGKVVPLWKKMAGCYEPLTYRPKKGTVLIWHENLLHAGSVRRDESRERRSVVIHAFADGVVGYYDSTGMAGSAASVSEVQYAQYSFPRELFTAGGEVAHLGAALLRKTGAYVERVRSMFRN